MSTRNEDEDEYDTTLSRLADRALQAASLVLGVLLATPFVLILAAPFVG